MGSILVPDIGSHHTSGKSSHFVSYICMIDISLTYTLFPFLSCPSALAFIFQIQLPAL